MVKVCECCGQPLPPDEVEVALPYIKRRIYQAVKKSGRRGITIASIMHFVYGDAPNGGPESDNVLHVHRGKMQPILARFGLRIGTDHRAVETRWMLEKL